MISRRHLPLCIISALALVALAIGSMRDPDFWSTADQRGDRLMGQRRFADAAKVYRDPMRAGIALYRGGSFEQAARTFAKVPGEDALFNAGDAWLMHGQYQQAIGLYDRVLGRRPGWKPAVENRAIAVARQALLDASGKDRNEESTEAYSPDKIAIDNKGGDAKDPQKPLTGPADDAALQATWLRRVKTTPAQFLKAKFAWQASQAQPVK